jgi:class 3 adenylate cyclase
VLIEGSYVSSMLSRAPHSGQAQGAPRAHEDHAARACYAALHMQKAMRRYGAEVRRTYGVEIRIRVGLNAGDAPAHGRMVNTAELGF